ncbi:DMP19 family protein [Mobilitalea sibirica]|uniref:DMP19 family protein n=1 Tax=Mobilitalea sibirica TaxID=1462919 RepID=UPI002ED5EB54
MEVANNGGFNQCYFNSSKQFTKMAVTGFKEIGAEGFAEIMDRANSIYSDIKDELEIYNDGIFKGDKARGSYKFKWVIE